MAFLLLKLALFIVVGVYLNEEKKGITSFKVLSFVNFDIL